MRVKIELERIDLITIAHALKDSAKLYRDVYMDAEAAEIDALRDKINAAIPPLKLRLR